MCIIAAIILMAFLGNLIVNDKTEHANLQSLQVSTLSPFSKVDFFIIPNTNKKSSFKKWIYGSTDPDVYVPIKSYKIVGDTAFLNVFYKDNFESHLNIDLKSYQNKYKIVSKRFI